LGGRWEWLVAAVVVMMLVGNVMPLTTGMNSLDPHIPWLTMSRESWMRLRRLCGWTVFICGLLALAVSSLLSDFRAMTACTMVLFLLPTIVACVYGTKLARASRLHPRVLRVIRL
jgi:uncharacterized membrane protein